MILNQEGKSIENPDLTLGKLEYKSLPVSCEWVIDKESVGHYEVIAEYPNGGKDVEWMVDEPEEGHWKITPEKDFDNDYSIPENASTHESFSDVWEYQEYIPYTDEELCEREKVKDLAEIEELKQKLAETDYCIIKIAEGVADRSEYEDVISNRAEWRTEINRLEESIKEGSD